MGKRPNNIICRGWEDYAMKRPSRIRVRWEARMQVKMGLYLSTALLCLSLSAADTASVIKDTAPAGALRLWYRQPAEKWVEALPVGNGRLGGMIFGKVRAERI